MPPKRHIKLGSVVAFIKRVAPLLSVLGLILGFIYFRSGKRGGKITNQNIRKVETAVGQSHQKIDTVQNLLKYHAAQQQETAWESQHERTEIKRKLDSIYSEPLRKERKNRQKFEKDQLRRWTDSSGAQMIKTGPSIPVA